MVEMRNKIDRCSATFRRLWNELVEVVASVVLDARVRSTTGSSTLERMWSRPLPRESCCRRRVAQRTPHRARRHAARQSCLHEISPITYYWHPTGTAPGNKVLGLVSSKVGHSTS